jgi:hypothetical protein
MKITTEARVSHRHIAHQAPSMAGDSMLTTICDQLLKVVVTKAAAEPTPNEAAPGVGGPAGAGGRTHLGHDPRFHLPPHDATLHRVPRGAGSTHDDVSASASSGSSSSTSVSQACKVTTVVAHLPPGTVAPSFDGLNT